jgi:hypothetical protein
VPPFAVPAITASNITGKTLGLFADKVSEFVSPAARM